MRDEAARMIDRLEDDNKRLIAEVDDAWDVLNYAGVDVQMVDTLADGVRKLVTERDRDRQNAEQWRRYFGNAAGVLRDLGAVIRVWEDGSDD